MIPTGYEAALLDSWDYFLHLAVVLTPLFIGASFLVGLAQEYLPPERVESMLRSRDHGSGNVFAAGLGAITPFCSCSTVPVLAGLLGAGAAVGMSFSFLLASPIVNWIAVFLLFGRFGAGVTVAYVVTALLSALVGGIVIGMLDLERYIKEVKITAGGREVSTAGREVATDGGTATGCGCSGGAPEAPDRTHSERFRAAGEGALSFFWDTLPYILIGISIGTVMAFVIGGAGISIPNLILLNKLFERKLLAIYAATVVTIGIFVGVLFNTVLVRLL